MRSSSRTFGSRPLEARPLPLFLKCEDCWGKVIFMLTPPLFASIDIPVMGRETAGMNGSQFQKFMPGLAGRFELDA
jgi:hypothetical protein